MSSFDEADRSVPGFEIGSPSDVPVGRRLGSFVAMAAVVYLLRPWFHSIFYQMRFNLTALFSGLLILLVFAGLWFGPRIRVGELDGRGGSFLIKIALFIGGTVVITLLYVFAALAFVIGLVAFVGIVARLSRTRQQSLGRTSRISIALTVGLLVVTVSFGLAFASETITEREMAEEITGQAEATAEFPALNEQNPRLVPREVDRKQSTGSVSYRQHRLGTSDIARGENGSLRWSYPIQPEGFRNRLVENQRGVFMSDMTTIDNRTTVAADETEFAVGEGMIAHRGADWNLKKSSFWAQYTDASIDFVHDGDPYMAYPKTGHEWRVELVFGVIPVPYTVPVWDGVALLHTDGTIDNFEPSEARNSEILDGQRLYPFDVKRQYMATLGYRNGIINQLPIVGAHENEVEIADMPEGTGNSQPFLIDRADKRFMYVTAFEPFGDDTSGLDEIWMVDSRTGEYQFFQSEGETLIGPERAMGIVRSEDTQTQWGEEFETVEPVPVFIDGELWWHSKVVPTDNLDVSRNVFVSAESGDAIEILTTNEISEFISGDISDADVTTVGENESVDVEEQPAEDGTESVTIITITDENGTVIEEIEVEEDEEITIKSSES